MNGTATNMQVLPKRPQSGNRNGKGNALPKSTVYKIIDELMSSPEVSPYQIASKFKVSHQTVKRIAAARDAMVWLREDPKWQELNAMRTRGPRRAASKPMQLAHEGDGVLIVPADKIAVPEPKPLPPQYATSAIEKPQEAREEAPVPDTTSDAQNPAESVVARQPTYDPSTIVVRYGALYRELHMGNVTVVSQSPNPPTDHNPHEIAAIASVIRQAGPYDRLGNAIDEALTWHDWDNVIAASVDPTHEKYGRARLLVEQAVGIPAMQDEWQDDEYAKHPALMQPDEWTRYPAHPIVETEAPREPTMRESRIHGHILGLIDEIGAASLGLIELSSAEALDTFVANLETAHNMAGEAIADLHAALDKLLGRSQ